MIITKADKGGAVAIIDVEDYVKEAEYQLHNKYGYKKLQYDPTQTHSRLVNDPIARFKNDKLITENIAKGLPDTPKFYTRSKIHKTGNPGRPVVSFVNCHNYTISKYVDFHLQPTVENISSYERDTADFLQKLDKAKNIPNDCLLVTLDVKSLYTNIPNNEGIKALIYIDKNNTLQKTLYRKPTDQQAYFHAPSDHTKSLKKSIPYSLALRIKIICSTLTEYKKLCAILKQNFIERG